MRNKISQIFGIIITLFFGLNLPSFSQFGQNKVQYKVFDWKYIQTKHFDIYFYQEGEDIAQYTAVTAEKSLSELENHVGYHVKNRLPLIVYNSHNEFQQNNIVDEYLPEGVGGVTELFKNRITVPFEGDYPQFKHVIHHEILHAYMNDMYYGGSIQNIISQNIRLQFPLWFSEGMAEYQSLSGMDKANDMFMRDAVIYDYIPDIDYVGGYLSYRAGQSFFSWLADTYGKEKIGDLMQQIKALGDVYEGFEDVYGFTTEELSTKWRKSLKQQYWPDISSRQEVTDFANRVTNHLQGDGFYNTAPAISPNGKYIVYISNRDDYFSLYLAETRTGKIISKVIEGNTTANFEELHLLAPGLCWSPDSRKIVISVKAGDKDAIYVVDIKTGDEREVPTKFDGIFAVNWNPKNNSIVFVGNNSKQSDIFVYNLNTKKLQRITDDLFYDFFPTWSRDGNKIYFTSNRGNYTDLSLNPGGINIDDYERPEKNLYEYDMKEKTLKKFSSTQDANESHVVSSGDGKKVLFISDRNGINNIWMKDLETGEEKPVTNSLDPINLLSISEDGKRLAFSALNHGGYDIFYIENPFDIDLKMADLPKTEFMNKVSVTRNENDSLTLKGIQTSVNNLPDSLRAEIREKEKETIVLKDTDSRLETVPSDTLSTSDSVGLYGKNIALNLSPNSYDSTLGKEKFSEDPKFKVNNNKNTDGSFKVNKYKIKFSPDIIYSNVNYSSFYGVQGIAQLAFSDILGNHRIYVATSLVLDLKNSDYAFAYYYLPKKIDYGFEVYHSARFLMSLGPLGEQLFRYRTLGAGFSASFPLSRFNRFDGALTFSKITKENLDNPNYPVENLYSLVPFISYVHDNTLFGYNAPIRGTRYNLTLLGSPNLSNEGLSFMSGVLDFRTYFRFLGDYNFAWRFNAGYSGGEDPQKFYLGGTDGWINYRVANNVLPIEDLKDYAFSVPVLPLRGYPYNIRSGSKFALMNTEFRFPLFKYMVLGPLPLAFQNILGVAFLDVGTAWTNNEELRLFSKDMTASLKTQDLLVGMGLGARIFLFYFPLKFDVAWSYNMHKFSQPMFYFSLGADF